MVDRVASSTIMVERVDNAGKIVIWSRFSSNRYVSYVDNRDIFFQHLDDKCPGCVARRAIADLLKLAEAPIDDLLRYTQLGAPLYNFEQLRATALYMTVAPPVYSRWDFLDRLEVVRRTVKEDPWARIVPHVD